MLRRLVVIPVALVFASVLLGLHAYLAARVVTAPAWSPGWTRFGTALVWSLAALLIIAPVAERFLSPQRARFLVWPSAVWMGTGWLVLVGLVATDVVLLLLGFVGSADFSPAVARGRAVLVLALVLPAAVIGLRAGRARPLVHRVRVGLSRWPSGMPPLRIVQITDIHIGVLLGQEFARWLTDRVNALEPDLIAVTGDLVDGTVEHLRDRVAPFADLSAPHGVFFVTGNHDHYSGGHAWAEEVERLGFTTLRNRHVRLDVDGREVVLAGVDDHRGGFLPGDGGEDLGAALAGVGADRPVILLAHDPLTFKAASKQGVDLQISGHTHGGQIWPFHYLVRLAMPWVAGLHRVEGSLLWVSRGTGFWGPPMRLGAPSEITELSVGSSLTSH